MGLDLRRRIGAMRNGENPCCASCQEASLTLAPAPCGRGKRRGCRRGWVRLITGRRSRRQASYRQNANRQTHHLKYPLPLSGYGGNGLPLCLNHPCLQFPEIATTGRPTMSLGQSVWRDSLEHSKQLEFLWPEAWPLVCGQGPPRPPIGGSKVLLRCWLRAILNREQQQRRAG